MLVVVLYIRVGQREQKCCSVTSDPVFRMLQEVLSSISVTVVVALLNSISLMILMVVVLLVYAYWGTALFHQVTKGEGIELR